MTPYTSDDEDLRGVLDPDFLAIGLGGTSMMSMLWAIAMGKRAVGIEMRGDPFLGVHWNIRADLYHQLGLIDKLMIDRYGLDRIPRRGNTDKPFLLAETFYGTETTAGDIVADEVIDMFDADRHISGTIHHVEFIDDRWRHGIPNRNITLLNPPKPPTSPSEAMIRTNMIEVLDGPSTFQSGASVVLTLLRRYLEKMEQMDLESDAEPRLRLFCHHRVVNTPDGMVKDEAGNISFKIESLQELDYKGKFVRVRKPGSKVIEIGKPKLFMIAEGFHSTDAERLGFKQEDVVVDHNDGRGPVVAQADYLAGLIEALIGGRLRRRIASTFDTDGQEYWVRQIAVGHEDDPEVGWCLVQVPDFLSFDPIKAGVLPEGTDTKSPEYFAAYDNLVYDFYCQEVGAIIEMPKEEVKKIQTVYGPKLFSLVERMGTDALLAPNGVVAGDSFGNGHFMTSGGAMTGMIGHSWRVYEYYLALNEGVPHEQALRRLADKIKEDTEGWLHVSQKEYSEAVPINFGAERIAAIEKQSGVSAGARAASIDATRRQRHSLLPLNPSDWRRLFLRNGKVFAIPLPELHAMHPALRDQRPQKSGARISVVFVAPDLQPSTIRLVEGVLGQPGVSLGLVAKGSIDELPERTRERLAAFATCVDPHDADQIVAAVRGMWETLRKPERLICTSDEIQVPAAKARETLGIKGMSSETASNFHDKTRMREKLAAAGIPIARYARIESVQDGLVFGTEIGYYPLVVKPNEGARADNTYRVNTEDELRALLERLQPTEDSPLICEEFVRGRECTLEVITVNGIPAWCSGTRFDPELLDAVLEPGTPFTITLPRDEYDPADPTLRQAAFVALKELGMDTGMATVSWFRRSDGTAVISNVAPNPPAGHIAALMGLAHGADMYRAWGNVAANGLFAPIPRVFAAGAVYFGTATHGTIAGVTGLDEVVRELGDVVAVVEAPQAGQPTSRSLGGNGYALVKHKETEVVEKALRRIAEAVRVEVTEAGRVMEMA